ncbi:MAG: phage baseplate assembly protein V [Myxococcota bacterium]|nr:phage baseplate assembly protein V [Myxococcota bacterium]
MANVTDRYGRPRAGQMAGLVEAIVIDNVDPDQLGRVKVKYPMLPDAPESYWARLVMPMAGKERGWMTIPEIDDEVLVSFVRGDINNAIVVGSLYNGKDTPPYANEDEKNNLRVFQSRSGHRLTFDDTDGAERVELILHNEEIKVIWDSTEKVLSVYSGKDIILESKENFSLKCKDFIVDASNSVNIKSGADSKLEAGANLNQQAGATLSMEASLIKLN